ncbi:hypothetical protein MYMA111404_02420 [Mycoplasma marinum]
MKTTKVKFKEEKVKFKEEDASGMKLTHSPKNILIMGILV